MKVNGQAIYGTTASPFKKLDWGRATTKGSTIYLHVFDWPGDGVLQVPLSGGVKKAFLLADPAAEVKVESHDKAGLHLHLPSKAPDPVASVIAIEIEGDARPIAPMP
jgi:alpha-L-fucosidase